MQKTTTGIAQSQYFTNYIFYCAVYSLLGLLFGVYGPLVPFWSENQHKQLTDYTVLVTVRTLFYIIGTFLSKIVAKYFSIHQILAIGLTLFAGFCFLFDQTQNMMLRCICYSFAALSVALFEVFANIAVLQIYKHQNAQKALVMMHGMLGAGFLMAPILVAVFKLYTHTSFAVFALVMIPVLRNLKSPEQDAKKQKQQEQSSQLKDVGTYSVFLCSFCYFIVTGIQEVYGAWISSFIIVKDLGDKESGILYTTIFWISITAFRVIFSLFPGKSSLKIRYLTLNGILVSLISLYIIYQIHAGFGLFFSSVLIGLCDSALFGLLQTQLHEYGFKANRSQLSTVFIFVGLGDGIIITTVGLLCQYTDWNLLIYWEAMSFVLVLIGTQLQSKHLKQRQSLQCQVIQLKERIFLKENDKI